MKWLLTISLCFIITSILFSDDFLRELPDENLLSVLTPEKFKNLDAVIIIKEQSYKIESDETFYRGYEIEGLNTSYTKIIVAKLFNEAAVKRYGSFEFEYYERYGDDIPNVFEVRVRVRKPDGEVLVMEEEEIQRIVSRESSSGNPLNRKVLFKVPNLAIGDVIQIEYTFVRIFASSTSNMFYYNDRDFVLYSNLYITLPAKIEAQYINFTDDRIGKPRIEQISGTFGSGETYFWGLKNLYPIPNEPYSTPFDDQSLMTAFVVEKYYRTKTGTWKLTTENFYEDYIDQDDIDANQFEFLTLNQKFPKDSVSFDQINNAYLKIREKFKLQGYTSLYPWSNNISSVFEKQEGDASDLSYIFYKILKQWGVNAKIVWIRDKREGKYEITVPSRRWFDRLGVLVNHDRKEILYDFDNCIPYNYSMPWYLKGQKVVVIKENGFEHKACKGRASINDNIYNENHIINIDSTLNLTDNIKLNYSGFPANKIRDKYYNYSKTEISDKLESLSNMHCLDECDSLHINDFRYNPEIEISLEGPSLSKPEEIDSFLIFKIKNQSFEDLYNNVFTTLRNGNYVFNGPFKIIVSWEINIPEGYTLHKDSPDKIFSSVGQISAIISRSLFSQKYSIFANFRVKKNFLSYKSHSDFISLLEDIKKELDQDIILKKI